MSYAEAVQKLEEMGLESDAWLHEVRKIITQMDIILEGIPPEQVDAVRALQEVLAATQYRAASSSSSSRCPW